MKPSCLRPLRARLSGLSAVLLLAGLLTTSVAAPQAPIPGSGGEVGKPPPGPASVDPARREPGRVEPGAIVPDRSDPARSASERIPPEGTGPERVAPERAAPSPKHKRKIAKKVRPGAGGETGGGAKAPPNSAY